jgi:type I restriction enzyme, S subunit
VTLGLLLDRIEAGKSFSALARPARDGEWGVVKVSAMSWGSFLADENKAVPEDRTINSDYEIRDGDLLLSRANTEDLVGATVLVGETRPRLLLSDKSLRLVPHEGIDKPWLNFTLRSSLVRAQFAERATGTSDSMRNLSQEKILATTLPLPSTAEQREIARRVDGLLGIAHRLQRRLEAASRRVERSSQAVLAKAFRGELIPTVADQPRSKTRDALGSAVR